VESVLLAAVLALVLFASIAKTVTGFGFALIAVPALANAIDVRDAVVLAALLSLANSLQMAARTWHDLPWRSVGVLFAATLAGMPAGLAVLHWAEADVLRAGVGAASLVLAAAVVRGRPLRAGVGGEIATGLCTGLLTTSTSMNGPPIVLYLQGRRLAPAEFRGALAGFFAVTGVVSVASFALTGAVTRVALGYFAAGLPAVWLGGIAGERLARRLEPELFRRVVLGLLVASASVALVTSLARLLV
jgi:hypothetical protein